MGSGAVLGGASSTVAVSSVCLQIIETWMALVLFFIVLAFSCLSLVRTRMLLLPILNAELAAQAWYFSASSRECDLAVVVLKAHQPEKRQSKRQLL